MVDREILATRLGRLRQAVRKLQPIASRSRDEYLACEVDRALSEHYLRIALEAMLDSGNHVIAAEGYRKPLHLRDIPAILAEEGVIERVLADKLKRAVGLRNRLVHGYSTVDHGLLYDVLQRDSGDLADFAEVLAKRYGPERGTR
ncbi:MAG: DUF86 domain-containing protein [Planctomycetes bacterium]|nr:DUF86 domain-containing protein [Planctomycetota bacterium]